MASIQRETVKKDGTISFTIFVNGGTDSAGNRLRKTVTYNAQSKAITKARKEAEKFAAEFELQFKTGDLLVSDKITFGEFVEIWEKNWLPSKTPTVQENYMDVLRVRVLPYLENKRLTLIKAPLIDSIIAGEQAAGKAPATSRMTFNVINNVFKYALKKNYIRENPCTRCDDLPSVAAKTGNDIQYFTPEQTKTFLNVALVKEYPRKIRGHKRKLNATGKEYDVGDYTEVVIIPLQWRVYFTLSVFSSIRRGEQCAITWEDIDFKNGIISINKAIAKTKKNGQIVKSTKTEAGIRDLTIPPRCIRLLAMLKQEQQTKAIEMGTAWKGHRNGENDSFDKNYVFIQYDGQLIDLSTPTHKFKEIINMYNNTVENAADKLPLIRLHDLRHTGATLLISEGMDIETVSRRLGHSKASVTLDIYGHALPENDRKAANYLEKMLGS